LVSEKQSRKNLNKILREHEERIHDISEDPYAIYGGVVSEFIEDYEKALPGIIRKAVKEGKVLPKHANEVLGDLATAAFERKVYRGGKRLLRGKPCPKCKSYNTGPRYTGSGRTIWMCDECGHRWNVPAPWWWKEGT